MGYSKQVVEAVKEEFARRRSDAEQTAAERKAEMYEKEPMLRQIDSALAMTGLKIYKAALDGKEGLEERIAALRKENLELQDDKRRILEAHGKPADYLSVKYVCPHCSDTGYDGLKMCTCMKKALVREAYASSGLGAVLSKQTFDNFSLDYYSDVKNERGVSPRDNMTNILAAAKSYVKDFGKESKNKPEKSENLLFLGKTGLGKTHISTAIAAGVMDKGYDVVYDTVQNIVHTYELQTFASDAEAAQSTERYAECALLIIDDLGTEFKSSFTASVLYNLLNARIMSGRAMIVSTNLDTNALLQKQYDDRILSRLIGNFRTFKFFGEDIRIKRAIEKK